MDAAFDAQQFFEYVRRRLVLMFVGGPLGFAAAVVVGSLTSSVNLAIWMGFMGFAAGCVVISAIWLTFLAARGKALVGGPCRLLELQTWPYKSNPRAPFNNAMLATLDTPESKERTPLLELKLRWWTPGMGRAPVALATVYGGDSMGSVVLAVNEHGGVLGRVRNSRLVPWENRAQ